MRRCTIGLPGKFAQRTPSGDQLRWSAHLESFCLCETHQSQLLGFAPEKYLKVIFPGDYGKVTIKPLFGEYVFLLFNGFEAYLSLRWEYNKPLRDFKK